jgi:signal transduction histidine kinase
MSDSIVNVLIVDDDEGDRKQLRRTLKETGLYCECVEAVSLERAMAACGKSAFDCVFVDYRMPGDDGLHSIDALRERYPFMPIVMVSGQGDEMVASEAIKLGATDYIAKKRIGVEAIKRCVENAMEKSALQRKVAQQQEELQQFAAAISHDLSAPIASIQLFVSEIQQGLTARTARRDETLELCENTVSAARHVGEIIDMLHEYTRVDGKVSFEPIEMRGVMDIVLSNLSRVLQERRALVTQSSLPRVTGNGPQLVLVLQNLISNAVKYCTAPVPTVRVFAKPDTQNSWLFSVEDNGIGIPKSYYTQVFEPFKRLHGAGEYEGTGLGLAICKKIVERHGGVIRCESNKGAGTTFFFTLNGAASHALAGSERVPAIRRAPEGARQ